MSFIKTTFLAALLGFVAQVGASGETKTNGYPAAVAQSAEKFYGSMQSEVSNGIQMRLNAKEIAVKDLDGLLSLFNSCTLRLREAGYDEKLTRAGQQVESVNTQMLAALKDPGNKEVFATGLEPEKCLQQIRLQKSSGIIIEKKLIRLRSTVEELRKGITILEPVTPAEQLNERIKLRLTQLLSEWNQEPGTPKEPNAREQVKTNRNTPTETNFAAASHENGEAKVSQIINLRPARSERAVNHENPKRAAPAVIEISPTAAKVLKMTRERVREKTILKYVNNSSDPFMLKTADQILYLRTNSVSSPVIAAMLQRDATLR